MTLGASHGVWKGSYLYFEQWRAELARAGGYVVVDVRDGSGHAAPTPVINWNLISDENMLGKWEKTPADPLIVLMVDSDCEGAIYPEQAVPLAERIERLMPTVPAEWREQTETFVAGLRAAAGSGEAIAFN